MGIRDFFRRSQGSGQHMTVEAYAAWCGLPQDEIWSKIEKGELPARQVEGKTLVVTPLQKGSPETSPAGASAEGQAVSTTEQAVAGTTEMALLIDHLSIAKEENREILRLTQDAMTRMGHMSEQIVQLKDAVISAKEMQIELLQRRVEAQDHEMAKLRQEKEDLEMLARTFGV